MSVPRAVPRADTIPGMGSRRRPRGHFGVSHAHGLVRHVGRQRRHRSLDGGAVGIKGTCVVRIGSLFVLLDTGESAKSDAPCRDAVHTTVIHVDCFGGAVPDIDDHVLCARTPQVFRQPTNHRRSIRYSTASCVCRYYHANDDILRIRADPFKSAGGQRHVSISVIRPVVLSVLDVGDEQLSVLYKLVLGLGSTSFWTRSIDVIRN